MNYTDYLLGRLVFGDGAGNSGGGSGGGSLPAGAYWKQITKKAAFIRTSGIRHFLFQGDVYAAGSPTSTNTNAWGLYKLVGEEYEEITTHYLDNFYNPVTSCIIEFNGKVHIFRGESVEHLTWDGSETFTTMNSVEGRGYLRSAVVLNNELYNLGYSDGILRKWDEESDSWASVSGVMATYNEGAFAYDGDIYGLNGTTLYKLDGSVWATAATLPVSVSWQTWEIVGDILYFSSGGSQNAPPVLYKYDLINGTIHEVGLPPLGRHFAYYAYEGKLRASCISSDDASHATHVELYEVEESV